MEPEGPDRWKNYFCVIIQDPGERFVIKKLISTLHRMLCIDVTSTFRHSLCQPSHGQVNFIVTTWQYYKAP